MDIFELIKELPSVGALIVVVVLFLRSEVALRKDQKDERAAFLDVVKNHMDHSTEAQQEVAVALTQLTETLNSISWSNGDAKG